MRTIRLLYFQNIKVSLAKDTTVTANDKRVVFYVKYLTSRIEGIYTHTEIHIQFKNLSGTNPASKHPSLTGTISLHILYPSL